MTYDRIVFDSHFDTFLSLSVILTGYEENELRSTGLAEDYYAAATKSLDVIDFLNAFQDVSKLSAKYQFDAFQVRFNAMPSFHACAGNIIKLWYLGVWNNHYANGTSYQEGLIWTVAGAHPPGAKQPGFGSWQMKPLHI